MATVTPNYNVDYNDKRFAQVESEKRGALSNVEAIYGGMINATDGYYNSLINESKAWAEEQKKQQQAQTDFAIDKIEQQKEQANKEYTREQSGAYVDWQKQSNAYGVNAEQIAAAGMQNSGFAESSQVSMYNTYQNRVSTARESYMLAIQNYDNNIKDAMLQNSAALAQLAHDALKQQLELALEGFQYKNNLVIEKANKRLEVENTYYNRYKDVLAQINHENEMKEQARQFSLNYDLKLKEYNEGIRQFNEEIARLKAKDAQENALAIQELQHKKAQLEEEKRQFNASMAEQQRQFNAKQKASSSGGSSGGTINKSGSSGSSGSGSIGTQSNSNPKIDQKSWNAVQKSLGVPLTQADMARYVANGIVTMKIANGTAYFTLSPTSKQQGLVGSDRGHLDLR